MKAKYLIILLFSAVPIACASQKIKGNKNPVDSFLKWFLKTREEELISKRTVTLNIEFLQDLAEEIQFSPKDSLEIQKQITQNNSSIFNYDTLTGKTFLNDSSLSKRAYKAAHLYLRLSKPIFFDRGNKVWIFIEEHCGDSCASGIIEVYAKSKSGYVLLLKKLIWIS